MRVLHVYKNYRPETQGGVEQVINDLCEVTIQHGHEADVFTTAPVKALTVTRWENHKVIQSRRDFERFSTPVSREMLMQFRRVSSGYDLVHYHFPWPFMDAVQELSRSPLPYVVTYHSDVVRQKVILQLYRPLMMRFLNRAACVVATSDRYAATSTVLNSISAPKASVPLGISPPGNWPVDRSRVAPAISTIVDSKQPYFIFVGVLRYYKGLNFLIEAARTVSSKIVIAGDGPERAALKAQVEKAGLSNVVFAGRINDDEKWLLLRSALAFVFPSHKRSEAFGISLLEAGAVGTPMISCEIGTGTSFANADGETGFVVEPENAAALAAAMHKLESDRSLARRFGDAAQKRFHALFTRQQMTGQYLALYEQVLAQRSGKFEPFSKLPNLPAGLRPAAKLVQSETMES